MEQYGLFKLNDNLLFMFGSKRLKTLVIVGVDEANKYYMVVNLKDFEAHSTENHFWVHDSEGEVVPVTFRRHELAAIKLLYGEEI